MNDVERDLRALLRGKAEDIPRPDVFPYAVLRKARLRRAMTASLVTIILLAAGAGGVTASRALSAAEEWRPATPIERLVDLDRLNEDMTPVGAVKVIAEGESEQGPFTYLGWRAEDYDVCLQFVVGDEAQQTSCYPPEQPPGPLYVSVGRSEGWENRMIDGMVDGGIARLEARMSGGARFDVPIYPAPEGLSVHGRNFVVGFVPGALTGDLVAFDPGGRKVASQLLPYIEEPDPADDPRLDEQIDKVTLAQGRVPGPNDIRWRYRAWRTEDGGLCTEVRLRETAQGAFHEAQSQCLTIEGVDRLGDEVIAVERWLWHSDMAFVAGFASREVKDVVVGTGGAHDIDGFRLIPLDASLGGDVSGFQFVAGWVPGRGDADVIALGSGDLQIGSQVVDVQGPEVTEGSQGGMSCEESKGPEIARLFHLFGSQPARLAAMLEAVLAPIQVCSVESQITVPAKLKRPRRD